MTNRILAWSGVGLGIAIGAIFVATSGYLQPIENAPGTQLGGLNLPAMTHRAPWKQLREIVHSGPWTGTLAITYKPVKPLALAEGPIRPRLDVVLNERLTYHALFPPTLVRWPDVIPWPPYLGGANQGPPEVPQKIGPSLYAYGTYSVQSPSMLISVTQLQRVVRHAGFVIEWRGRGGVLAPLRTWGWGPRHQRTLQLAALRPHRAGTSPSDKAGAMPTACDPIGGACMGSP